MTDAQSKLLIAFTSTSLPQEVLERESGRLEQERLGLLRMKAEVERERDDADARRKRLMDVQAQLTELATHLESPTPEQMRQMFRVLVSRISVGIDEEGQRTLSIKYVFGDSCPVDGPAHRPLAYPELPVRGERARPGVAHPHRARLIPHDGRRDPRVPAADHRVGLDRDRRDHAAA